MVSCRLLMNHTLLLKMAIYSGLSRKKWWISPPNYGTVYQRVIPKLYQCRRSLMNYGLGTAWQAEMLMNLGSVSEMSGNRPLVN